MDEFAQLSRENFEVFQRYGDPAEPNPKHRAIAVHASPGAETTYVEKDLKLDHLPKFFGSRPRSSNSDEDKAGVAQAASLKLVVIDSRLESWSNPSPSLWTNKDVFLRLVDAMNMNPAALWLLRSEYDGFHYFLREDEEDSSSTIADTYYIGTSTFVLIWTFDRQHGLHNTRALWILRRQQSISNSAPAAWFINVLRRHREHAYSPFLLAYAAVLSTCCSFDGEISYRAHVVRLIERQTGYNSAALNAGIEERIGLQPLTVSIKEVGQVLNHNANKERHFRLMDGVLDFIEEHGRECIVSGMRISEEVASTRRLLGAIPLLRSRMHASREYLTYLKERAERLSTVLFALLTHEDSATHAELADASRSIAEAARRDSSSMKTVAIMTMAFLPATFFAALFSVPSLDWTPDPGQSIIRSSFWVYWAFTLPATALVFGLWLLFDYKAERGGSRSRFATSHSSRRGVGGGVGEVMEEGGSSRRSWDQEWLRDPDIKLE